jgi:hypothetical protein
LSNYDTDKVIVPLNFFTSTFGGGLAQSSRAGGSLLRAPWPAGQSENGFGVLTHPTNTAVPSKTIQQISTLSSDEDLVFQVLNGPELEEKL